MSILKIQKNTKEQTLEQGAPMQHQPGVKHTTKYKIHQKIHCAYTKYKRTQNQRTLHIYEQEAPRAITGNTKQTKIPFDMIHKLNTCHTHLPCRVWGAKKLF